MRVPVRNEALGSPNLHHFLQVFGALTLAKEVRICFPLRRLYPYRNRCALNRRASMLGARKSCFVSAKMKGFGVSGAESMQ